MSTLVGRPCLEQNFKAMHFVVLPESLADEFTWVTQRGPAYQYGYLLKEPITDYAVALDMIRRLYARFNYPLDLPCGFGWAPSERTQVVEWIPDNRWTVDELLRCTPEISLGTSPWRDHTYLINGIVDDVLEWLVDERLLLHQAPKSWRIVCPWADEHFEESATWYSPGIRRFQCADPACAGRGLQAMLEEIYLQGGPAAPIRDRIGEVLAEWARAPDFWVNLKSGHTLIDRKFKHLLQETIRLPRGYQRWLDTSLYSAVYAHPRLLRLFSMENVPDGPPVIDSDGVLAYNRYHSKGPKEVNDPDDLSRIIDWVIHHCDREYQGAVLPNDILHAIRRNLDLTRILETDGVMWRDRARHIIRQHTSAFKPSLNISFSGRPATFRYANTPRGHDLALGVRKNDRHYLRKYYSKNARNAIIQLIKQRLAGELPNV